MRRHEGPCPRQTRIVATLGPAADGDYPKMLEALCAAGVDVLRLNFSHADADYAKESEILAWANRPVQANAAPTAAVMADLQGPKMRIGMLPPGGLNLVEGQPIRLVREETATPPSQEGGLTVAIPEPVASALFAALRDWMRARPGEPPKVVFGDGDPVAQVTRVEADEAYGIVCSGGVLGSHKGITVRGIDLDLEAFPEKDQRDLLFALQKGVDYVALSFVRTAKDLERVRAFVAAHRPNAPTLRLIAKIETVSSIWAIEGILAASDGIMVARGDLGLQLGVEEVPAAQKQLIAAARRAGKPCIVATQMLESMIQSPAPTRAEASDVFNAILDGGDAVMLSGETSVGHHPIEAVATMDRIVRKAEAWCNRPEVRQPRPGMHAIDAQDSDPVEHINAAFASTAVQFAETLSARAIVCSTRTGRTPERLSQHRPSPPILAYCASEGIARELLMYYGVFPVLLAGFDPGQQRFAVMIDSARAFLRENYGLHRSDALVVTAGIDWRRGGTNTLRVVIEDHDAAPRS